MNDSPKFTTLGKFVSILLVVGLIGLGAYMLRGSFGGGSSGAETKEAESTEAPSGK